MDVLASLCANDSILPEDNIDNLYSKMDDQEETIPKKLNDDMPAKKRLKLDKIVNQNLDIVEQQKLPFKTREEILKFQQAKMLDIVKDAHKKSQSAVVKSERRREAFKKIVKVDVEVDIQTTKKVVKKKNVLEKMEGSTVQNGPFKVLYDCVKKGVKAKVYIRRYKGLRGILTGYIVAFDLHMNLAMIEIEEIYSIETWMIGEPLKKKRERKKKVSKTEAEGNPIGEPVGNLEIKDGALSVAKAPFKTSAYVGVELTSIQTSAPLKDKSISGNSTSTTSFLKLLTERYKNTSVAHTDCANTNDSKKVTQLQDQQSICAEDDGNKLYKQNILNLVLNALNETREKTKVCKQSTVQHLYQPSQTHASAHVELQHHVHLPKQQLTEYSHRNVISNMCDAFTSNLPIYQKTLLLNKHIIEHSINKYNNAPFCKSTLPPISHQSDILPPPPPVTSPHQVPEINNELRDPRKCNVIPLKVNDSFQCKEVVSRRIRNDNPQIVKNKPLKILQMQRKDITRNKDINKLKNKDANELQNKDTNILQNKDANKLQNKDTDILQNKDGNELQNKNMNKSPNKDADKLQNKDTNNLQNKNKNKLQNKDTNKLQNKEITKPQYEKVSTHRINDVVATTDADATSSLSQLVSILSSNKPSKEKKKQVPPDVPLTQPLTPLTQPFVSCDKTQKDNGISHEENGHLADKIPVFKENSLMDVDTEVNLYDDITLTRQFSSDAIQCDHYQDDTGDSVLEPSVSSICKKLSHNKGDLSLIKSEKSPNFRQSYHRSCRKVCSFTFHSVANQIKKVKNCRTLPLLQHQHVKRTSIKMTPLFEDPTIKRESSASENEVVRTDKKSKKKKKKREKNKKLTEKNHENPTTDSINNMSDGFKTKPNCFNEQRNEIQGLLSQREVLEANIRAKRSNSLETLSYEKIKTLRKHVSINRIKLTNPILKQKLSHKRPLPASYKRHVNIDVETKDMKCKTDNIRSSLAFKKYNEDKLFGFGRENDISVSNIEFKKDKGDKKVKLSKLNANANEYPCNKSSNRHVKINQNESRNSQGNVKKLTEDIIHRKQKVIPAQFQKLSDCYVSLHRSVVLTKESESKFQNRSNCDHSMITAGGDKLQLVPIPRHDAIIDCKPFAVDSILSEALISPSSSLNIKILRNTTNVTNSHQSKSTKVGEISLSSGSITEDRSDDLSKYTELQTRTIFQNTFKDNSIDIVAGIESVPLTEVTSCSKTLTEDQSDHSNERTDLITHIIGNTVKNDPIADSDVSKSSSNGNSNLSNNRSINISEESIATENISSLCMDRKYNIVRKTTTLQQKSLKDRLSSMLESLKQPSSNHQVATSVLHTPSVHTQVKYLSSQDIPDGHSPYEKSHAPSVKLHEETVDAPGNESDKFNLRSVSTSDNGLLSVEVLKKDKTLDLDSFPVYTIEKYSHFGNTLKNDSLSVDTRKNDSTHTHLEKMDPSYHSNCITLNTDTCPFYPTDHALVINGTNELKVTFGDPSRTALNSTVLVDRIDQVNKMEEVDVAFRAEEIGNFSFGKEISPNKLVKSLCNDGMLTPLHNIPIDASVMNEEMVNKLDPIYAEKSAMYHEERVSNKDVLADIELTENGTLPKLACSNQSKEYNTSLKFVQTSVKQCKLKALGESFQLPLDNRFISKQIKSLTESKKLIGTLEIKIDPVECCATNKHGVMDPNQLLHADSYEVKNDVPVDVGGSYFEQRDDTKEEGEISSSDEESSVKSKKKRSKFEKSSSDRISNEEKLRDNDRKHKQKGKKNIYERLGHSRSKIENERHCEPEVKLEKARKKERSSGYSKERDEDGGKLPRPDYEQEREREKERNKEQTKVPKKNRTKDHDKERNKGHEIERDNYREKKRRKDLEKERNKAEKKPSKYRGKEQNDYTKERNKDREMELSKDYKKERSKDREIELCKDLEIELRKDYRKERSKDLEIELSKENKKERSKDREIELIKDYKKERCKNREIELSKDYKKERSKNREIELSKEYKKERSKDREIELSKDREIELRKDYKKERSKDREIELKEDYRKERSKDRKIELSKDYKKERSKYREIELCKDLEIELSKDYKKERSKNREIELSKAYQKERRKNQENVQTKYGDKERTQYHDENVLIKNREKERSKDYRSKDGEQQKPEHDSIKDKARGNPSDVNGGDKQRHKSDIDIRDQTRKSINQDEPSKEIKTKQKASVVKLRGAEKGRQKYKPRELRSSASESDSETTKQTPHSKLNVFQQRLNTQSRKRTREGEIIKPRQYGRDVSSPECRDRLRKRSVLVNINKNDQSNFITHRKRGKDRLASEKLEFKKQGKQNDFNTWLKSIKPTVIENYEKPERGKIFKKRHVNQMFVRGDNIVMVAYDENMAIS